MSGGVDSTGAALLLREAGQEALGLTGVMTLPPGAAQAAERAAELCTSIGIPHHVIDLRADFERLVVQPFIDDYARGRTPNPCVRCNERVKFGLLLGHARRLGADRLATGHYARTLVTQTGDVSLLRALDARKDQSYVLHRLSQEQLRAAVFVHGDRTKDAVARLVAAAGLSVEPLSESQDLCFLLGSGHVELLRARVPETFKPGEIVDGAGVVLGEHAGLAGYTVGQRKGLDIGGPGGRKFVLHIDVAGNRLVIGEDGELWVQWCVVEELNLIASEGGRSALESALVGGLRCEVMVRYNGNLTRARVAEAGCGARIEFEAPVRAPTPGQSAVLYDGEFCLGGGVIMRTELTARFGG
jgi:tRNA-specific 2-thiouridylase